MNKKIISPKKNQSIKGKAILHAVLPVFGRLGFRKASVEDLAQSAGLSKQGLYMHFRSKEEIFIEAMQLYLEEGLELVDISLEAEDACLVDRLTRAMDVWFGRHWDTFTPDAFDVIQAGNYISKEEIDSYKDAFRDRLKAVIIDSPEYEPSENSISPDQLAQVLFTFGLTWKESCWSSRAEFAQMLHLCVKACLSGNQKIEQSQDGTKKRDKENEE